ncbi:MAG: hypothetical protein A4E20_04705 [Nitrospira sp. SG-bin2]|uniref:hypothetical protein n=1 Tax=Nitrospira cf. moscoviensis SBR1015 TaxID=96242 RepID=UPI000A0B9F09|nr:hypothetical protein [Nitrospira cf. moscoviensis SBR1015]OQW38077.1 MAG: hypothetical protein A4E20_04705 [Nitrospira sp. SG-bin2]
MPTINLPYNWQPRPYQRKLWNYLEGGGKRAVAVWHRRAGKDDVCLHWAATAAFDRVGSYWHMLPEATQARKAIWDAVNPHTGRRRIDEAFPGPLRDVTREVDMFIRFKNGSTWQVVGSDNFNSLVGSPPIGLVFSEYALANPEAWDYLRPILAENGGWSLFIYTPRGRNHGKVLYDVAESEPAWFAERLRAAETGVFTPESLDEERRQLVSQYGEDVGLAKFRQEYECSFEGAILGAYYAREMAAAELDKRIASVPWEPSIPVITAWDLGIDDETSIWFAQLVGKEVHLIDHIHGSGHGMPHYANLVKQKPYAYSEHLLPHDAEPRERGSGKSIDEVLRSLELKTRIIPRMDVMDGINAARNLLPKCWFDAKKCAYGIESLQQYRTEYDDDKKTFKTTPYHDWTSHAADAFRYLALGLKPLQPKPVKKPNVKWVV